MISGVDLSSPGHVPSSSGSHVIGGEATQALAPLRIQSHLLSTHSLFTPKEGEKVTVEHLQISVPKLSEPFHSFIHSRSLQGNSMSLEFEATTRSA